MKNVGCKLGGGGVHAYMFRIRAGERGAGKEASPGVAVVEWGEGGGGGEAVLPLPPVEVGGGGLSVELNAPTQGFRGGAMGITLCISNMTAAYQVKASSIDVLAARGLDASPVTRDAHNAFLFDCAGTQPALRRRYLSMSALPSHSSAQDIARPRSRSCP